MFPRASIFSCPLETQGDVFVAGSRWRSVSQKPPQCTDAEPALCPVSQKGVTVDADNVREF